MKTFLFLSVFFSSTSLFSQLGVPFPDEPTRWAGRYMNYDYPEYNHHYGFQTLSDDTIISGLTYRKVYTLFSSNMNYVGGMRESNNKVYFCPNQNTDEYLMYDFTLNVGEQMTNIYVIDLGFNVNMNPVQPLTVVQVDTVNYNNIDRKRIFFDYGGPWIEGIGGSGGLFEEFHYNLSMYSYELICVSVGQTTIYPSTTPDICFPNLNVEDKEMFSFELFPNPSDGTFCIRSEIIPQGTRIQISDLSGKILINDNFTSPEMNLHLGLIPGAYIVNFPDLTEIKSEKVFIH